MFGMILFGDVDFFILKFKLHLNRIHYFVQFMKLTFCKCSLQKKKTVVHSIIKVKTAMVNNKHLLEFWVLFQEDIPRSHIFTVIH